jgi:hypothetical protein
MKWDMHDLTRPMFALHVAAFGHVPTESSRGEKPAELVGVAQPATRRMLRTDRKSSHRQAARVGAQGDNDYGVIGPDGIVIGRIFKATTSPVGTPWM